MNDVLARIVTALNAVADALGATVFAPIAVLPGWLSATFVAALTGVVLLVAFKYTSNQAAIRRVRDDLDANLLALKLFKDSTAVTLRSQARLIAGAGRMFLLSLVPMLAMALPVTLLLGQLALWYQARPLLVGEAAVLTLALAGTAHDPWPDIRLQPDAEVLVEVGPVRVQSQREVCWTLRGRSAGLHRLRFDIDGRTVTKQFAVGDGLMRVSALRPGWDWEEILRNPAEEPFPPDSPVRSITVGFPARASWTSGTDSWVIYWFAVSMIAALACRRAFNVKV